MAPVVGIACTTSSTWWIDALSRTTTPLGLTPSNGLVTEAKDCYTNCSNSGPVTVLKFVQQFRWPLICNGLHMLDMIDAVPNMIKKHRFSWYNDDVITAITMEHACYVSLNMTRIDHFLPATSS